MSEVTEPCPDCGHVKEAHRWYSRCTGTSNQPDCICTRTPREFEPVPADEDDDTRPGGASGVRVTRPVARDAMT